MSETVWILTRQTNGGGNQPTLHTDRDCHYLEQASGVRDVDPDKLFDEWDYCDHCAGEVESAMEPGVDPGAFRDHVHELDPDDLGLSPLGERGDAA